jgi:hypothetical protein
MNECGAQVKQSQIQEQVNRLAEAEEELHKAIELLENHLSDVLQSSMPTNKGGMVEEKTSSLVNLAVKLSERVASINVATIRINDIRSRLEV